MLKLGRQLLFTDVKLGIYQSFASGIHNLQSVLTKRNSLNEQYCIQRSLSAVAIQEKSSDWQAPELQKLYEDDWVMAISKPGSLFVHNCREASKREKEQKAFLKDLVEAQHNQGRPLFTVHRLDRGASGVILFAKCSLAAHATQLALAHEGTVKEYLVLARGSTPNSFICDHAVNDDKGIPRSAWTKCEKLLDLPKSRCSLLKVHIKTGRRHQIRKHLNHKAFHVIGDGRHGKGQTNQYFRENYQMPLGRCFLHAFRLTIPHPSIFSALCTDKEIQRGSLKSLDQMESEINSEHLAKELSPFINVEPGSSLASNPQILGESKIDYSQQALTVHASLPTDLRQVLLSLPDGVSGEFLDSFDVVI